MDEKTTLEFAKFNKKIRKAMLALTKQEKLSEKAKEQMLITHNNLIKYFLDRYIEKDNPARKEVENMLVVTERPPSLTELLIAEVKKEWEAEAKRLEAEAKKREEEAHQEIAKRDAEIAKLNAALIELAAKIEK